MRMFLVVLSSDFFPQMTRLDGVTEQWTLSIECHVRKRIDYYYCMKYRIESCNRILRFYNHFGAQEEDHPWVCEEAYLICMIYELERKIPIADFFLVKLISLFTRIVISEKVYGKIWRRKEKGFFFRFYWHQGLITITRTSTNAV